MSRYDYATDTETNTGQIYQQTYPGLGLLHTTSSTRATPRSATRSGGTRSRSADSHRSCDEGICAVLPALPRDSSDRPLKSFATSETISPSAGVTAAPR